MTAHAFVTGATGLIGRWLVPALTRQGYVVTALVRDAAKREPEYRTWVRDHGGHPDQVRVVEGDLGADDLGLSETSLELAGEASVVYHLGAAMQLGLDHAHTIAVNEGGTERMVRLAASWKHRPRFVLISGFRMGASKERDLDRAGIYEATKVRADRRTRTLVRELGLPLTVVNPGVVIGDSRTGETTLFWGFADIVKSLHRGKMPAVPGSSRHWMPLVTVDYLAEFLARVPPRDDEALAEYFLLDGETPALGPMMNIVARQLGVRAPWFHLPMPLVPILLRMTGQPEKIEGLTFISTDRYDVSSATRAAAEAGLVLPDIELAIRKSVDFLVARDFGGAEAAS
ncbi:MAG: SDR family oxidoreductase [Polyangiaceae bacterium]